MNKTVVKPGEIFEALGYSKEESASMLIRSRLMGDLREHIEGSGMSLRKAAAYFGVSHPRINDIMQGRIDKFTIDYLVNLAAKAGMKVTIHTEVKKAA